MLVLTVYILTFTVGFPANIFTFVTLLGKARRRVSPSDILLLNLTAADLLLLLFLPFKMAEAAAGLTWPLPAVLCPVANFCFYSSIYLSSLFLAALSVERYLGVVFPLQYKDRRRPRRAMAASIVLWLLACSHCSIVFVAQYHGGRNRTTANRSTFISSDGSAVNGFKPGSSKMSSADGFDSNGLTITSPDSFKPSISETSSSNTVDHKVFKVSNPGDSMDNGFVPHGSKITNSNISTHNGSRISSPSSPNTSKPNISKISTPNSANIQDISSPANVSQTSNIPTASSPGVHDGSNTTTAYKCYDDFSEDQLSFVLPLRLELFLVLFLLPFAVTIFCYINFVRALLARPNIPLEKKQRAVGLAVATMVNFGVCFAPYNISHVVGFVEKRSPDWRVYALLLTSLNAALDPVIFYFSSTAVQRAMAGVVVAVWDKLRAVLGCCYGACSPEVSQGESEGSLT
ncbi:free fatty acid receptor 2-like [Grus americana]|uniref:Free fatty acid receptor 1 n=1 Tax=Grus japonensis TaxID=30415 RepID=A0ABC9XT16_GRUJA|nr:free fatty acid receptor 2-like [Grus americana]XP_054660975.1 free fatty acid receptor 2-like [Grus americana]